MGLPYVQLDTDFIKRKSATISALLRVPRQLVVGMGADLFDWVVEETASEDSPPSGVLLDPEAPAIFEGVMQWAGEPGKAFDAFVRAGVIEKLEIGARVRGCDRYKTTWTKNQRRKPGGNRAVTVKKPGETGPERKSKKERKSKNLLLSEEGSVPLFAETQPPPQQELVVVPAGEPHGEWSAKHFWDWAQRKRLEAGCIPEKPPHQADLNSWWKSVRELVPDVESLKEAFYAYGEDEFWQAKKPPLPFAGFKAQWRNFTRIEAKSA